MWSDRIIFYWGGFKKWMLSPLLNKNPRLSLGASQSQSAAASEPSAGEDGPRLWRASRPRCFLFSFRFFFFSGSEWTDDRWNRWLSSHEVKLSRRRGSGPWWRAEKAAKSRQFIALSFTRRCQLAELRMKLRQCSPKAGNVSSVTKARGSLRTSNKTSRWQVCAMHFAKSCLLDLILLDQSTKDDVSTLASGNSSHCTATSSGTAAVLATFKKLRKKSQTNHHLTS